MIFATGGIILEEFPTVELHGYHGFCSIELTRLCLLLVLRSGLSCLR